ncbi:MAG TPA: hypothetical protein VFJ23_00230 [Candidatus Nitrosotalea sp.]|nr:hypothetical protein [Candidatus Nitrosotalea sp.]
MVRPEKQIDWRRVDELLEAGCLGTEICSHFDLTADRFYDRVKEKYGMSFTDYSQEKRQKGDSRLREKQFNKAIEGDNMMLIWLGKNRLGQKDKQEISEQSDKSITLKVNFDGNSVQVLPETLPTSDSKSS